MKNKPKKSGQFMKRIVMIILLAIPIITAIFVLLQLQYGLDPTPYLSYLAPAAIVELVVLGLLRSVSQVKPDHENGEESTEEIEGETEDEL